MQKQIKNELHNIISGKSEVRFGTTIQAVASYLSDGEKSSISTEVKKQYKKEEAERLEKYIRRNIFLSA